MESSSSTRWILALVAAGFAGAYVVVCAELTRSIVARVGHVVVDRWFGVMQLPGHGGSRKANVAAIIAGPLGAYLGVSILAFALYTCHGTSTDNGPYAIDTVMDGYDAVGKLEPGDRIVELEGTPREVDARGLSAFVNERGGAPVTVTVEHDGTRRSITIRPTLVDRTWRIGVVIARQHELATDLGPAALAAIEYPFLQSKVIIGGFVDLGGDEKPDPGGPARIVVEHTREPRSTAAAVLRFAMMIGVYALIVIALVDLTRLGLFVFRQL
jgi:membrane-associated protease RseP (regulator of RpoE activity)